MRDLRIGVLGTGGRGGRARRAHKPGAGSAVVAIARNSMAGIAKSKTNADSPLVASCRNRPRRAGCLIQTGDHWIT